MTVTAAFAVALALLAAIVWFLPGVVVDHDLAGANVEPKERLSAVNNVRATLLQAVGGLAIFAGAYVAWRQMRVGQEGLHATREGQITDRFGQAVDQTGSDKLDVRIGGLYSLWRVAEHSHRDREAVIAIMAAFLRIHLPWPPSSPDAPAADAPINSVPPLETRAPDAQVALTCLGVLGEGRRPEWLNLIATDLRRADCDGLHLQGVILDRACMAAASVFRVDLTRASLAGAILRQAELATSILRAARCVDADLRGARLVETDLAEADFTDADLREADLSGAWAAGTVFRRADLRMTNLRNADLSTADLFETLLEGAHANAATRWPAGFDPTARGVTSREGPEEDGPTSATVSGFTLRTDLPELRSYP
ncbi:pentapeptide repeat-containing protein [Streptomyces sp. ISL-10]|uniref:pentapeptide repeat-containing protein n=1 Tax=Streptomyces sp. ISL-10 TaxID=2819172 RepID=UPI001BE58D4D|nr:pentapeptide repeat-containing protein [Streptomyces sp. ISL-10]MBT2367008.1 pentapeptide repeat-containing protein [Streptomyces sp. ISL-10]